MVSFTVLTITIEVDAPAGQAIGIKEHLAMLLEQYGDTRVVEVKEYAVQQQLDIERRDRVDSIIKNKIERR